MKKWMYLLLMCFLLTGCAQEETFETIADEIVQPVMAQMREVIVTLPKEAAAPASESENGQLYLCDGYEIMLQTMAAGDLTATVRSVTGYTPEDLTVLEIDAGDWTRYELVWVSAGEAGDRVGRAAILDDGNYHYVLSVLADAQRVREYEGVWLELFDSYKLG